MSEFDKKARDWDLNPERWERSKAVAGSIIKLVPLTKGMKALDFGAGTGILSFMLADNFTEIIMVDSSSEMVAVMEEKVAEAGNLNLKPLFLDLLNSEADSLKVDCIYSLLVLHHIENTELILKKFFNLLNPGGYIAIADLYSEDGSFHGADYNGHNGFDIDKLKSILCSTGFSSCYHEDCYVVKKIIEGVEKEFPLFLLTARKE